MVIGVRKQHESNKSQKRLVTIPTICFVGVVIVFAVNTRMASRMESTMFVQQNFPDNPVSIISNPQTTSIVSTYNPKQLCDQNQYVNSLSLALSDYAELMDKWLANRITIEKDLTAETIGFEHDWTRFKAFEAMGGCNETCVGGMCKEDESKITCGVQEGSMEAPCVVYSIGGNNKWDFEMDLLKKTPCTVHTFDCTGDISRFKIPDHDRLHFHYICLGDENKPATSDQGEFWTLNKMQKTFNHTQIDLLKVDIEGYEWPLFHSWPTLTDITAPTTVLPMQVLVEVHYQTNRQPLSLKKNFDWKFTTDMINLQSHFLKMGYAVLVRDDNHACRHCTELTLVRIRCPVTQI